MIVLNVLSIGTLLGMTGVISGFYLPIILDPCANDGPLMGIIFTGPYAFVFGILVGLVLKIIRASKRTKIVVIIPSVLLIIGVTASLSLPEDRPLSRRVSGVIQSRSNPLDRLDSRVLWWDQQIKKERWIHPPLGWKKKIGNQFAQEEGCLVGVDVHSSQRLYLRKRPWNTRDTIVVEEKNNVLVEYYVEGCSCAKMKQDSSISFKPKMKPDLVTPPSSVANFLGVEVIDLPLCQ